MHKSVAIIGAGFSGTLTAIHLALRPAAEAKLDIYLIDPRGSFGPGLAYSPPSDRFKLNVRAKAMGAFPDDVEGFYRWAKERCPTTSADDFSPRRLYGEYLSELLDQAISRADGHTVRRINDEAIDIDPTESSRGWNITLRNGTNLPVDACVLAIGNFMQTATNSEGSTTPFRQPFNATSYEEISSCRSVFILGSSLTAVDVILECEARGFNGNYTVLSRHGRLPRAHESLPSSSTACLPEDWDTQGSTRALIETIRSESRRLGSSQPVFDAMRPKIQSMWRHFSLTERRRFLRHVRPIWDTHRHRIPAEHASVIESLRTSHRLEIIAGRLVEIVAEEGHSMVSFRARGSHAPTVNRAFEVAFICAGAEGDLSTTKHPLARRLLERQLLLPGPLKLGGLIPEQNEFMWLIGPLQREVAWEITAVRELREEAVRVAHAVTRQLARATI
ncbi:MAG: hypothetical protein RIS36_157 [Pseudomonadota bacterium]|jgi:uncharacterized NAD(P)/FAD-binding protein YdhS